MRACRTNKRIISITAKKHVSVEQKANYEDVSDKNTRQANRFYLFDLSPQSANIGRDF